MSDGGLDFTDESELQFWLKKQFRKHGWDAYREVTPKGTQYSADLIVHHDNYGWIGIECKHMNSLRSGSYVGRAVDQILFQYRGETYPKGAGEIDFWAVCPYTETDRREIGATQTIRELLCHFGIGILWPSEKSQYMKLDFAYSDSDTKIQIGTPESDEYGDIERISEMVSKKMVEASDDLGVCQRNTDGYGCSAPAVATVEFGDYEIHLCEHHYKSFERGLWEEQKEASTLVG